MAKKHTLAAKISNETTNVVDAIDWISKTKYSRRPDALGKMKENVGELERAYAEIEGAILNSTYAHQQGSETSHVSLVKSQRSQGKGPGIFEVFAEALEQGFDESRDSYMAVQDVGFAGTVKKIWEGTKGAARGAFSKKVKEVAARKHAAESTRLVGLYGDETGSLDATYHYLLCGDGDFVGALKVLDDVQSGAASLAEEAKGRFTAAGQRYARQIGAGNAYKAKRTKAELKKYSGLFERANTVLTQANTLETITKGYCEPAFGNAPAGRA